MTTITTELAQRMCPQRVIEIANGATPLMGEKEQLAKTALYLSGQLEVAIDAFQAAGLAQLDAEGKLEAATFALEAKDKQIAEAQRLTQQLCSNADADITALRQRIAELDASHAKLRDAMAAIHNTIKDGGTYTPLAAILNASKRAYEESALELKPLEARPEQQPLTVWYGPMPETNGKSNFTAILHRKDEGIQGGITLDRSGYPDRVRYEADRARYLIGELEGRPCIIDYDADAHSGYTAPPAPAPVTVKLPDGFGPTVITTGSQSPSYRAIMSAKGPWIHRDMITETLTAAGIKIAEGE